MDELGALNMITTIVDNYLTSIGYDKAAFKYPNVDIDQTENIEFIEMLFKIYTGVKINLKGSKRVFGCLTFKKVSSQGDGLGSGIAELKSLAELFSEKILNGVQFDGYDLLILNNTLSETQTTTATPFNQISVNIEFAFTR